MFSFKARAARELGPIPLGPNPGRAAFNPRHRRGPRAGRLARPVGSGAAAVCPISGVMGYAVLKGPSGPFYARQGRKPGDCRNCRQVIWYGPPDAAPQVGFCLRCRIVGLVGALVDPAPDESYIFEAHHGAVGEVTCDAAVSAVLRPKRRPRTTSPTRRMEPPANTPKTSPRPTTFTFRSTRSQTDG